MSDISEKVLNQAKLYLGPATRNFLDRQTKSHLNGLEFNELKQEHLPELLKWISISAGLIINEKAEVLTKKLELMFNVKRA
jgi:hypothetical protein